MACFSSAGNECPLACQQRRTFFLRPYIICLSFDSLQSLLLRFLNAVSDLIDRGSSIKFVIDIISHGIVFMEKFVHNAYPKSL